MKKQEEKARKDVDKSKEAVDKKKEEMAVLEAKFADLTEKVSVYHSFGDFFAPCTLGCVRARAQQSCTGSRLVAGHNGSALG